MKSFRFNMDHFLVKNHNKWSSLTPIQRREVAEVANRVLQRAIEEDGNEYVMICIMKEKLEKAEVVIRELSRLPEPEIFGALTTLIKYAQEYLKDRSIGASPTI